MADLATPDVTPTDSSPVPTPDLPIHDLTPDERLHWRKSGEKPSRKAKSSEVIPPPPDTTPPADSSPAAPADPAGSTEPSPSSASEPDTPTRKKQNAETRKAALDAEIQERLSRRRQLDQEIAEHEARLKQVKPSEAIPAPQTSSPVPESFPEFEEWLAIPGNETKGLGAYTKAVVAFERERATTEATLSQGRQARTKAYHERLEADISGIPDWQSKIAPGFGGLKTIDDLGPTEQARPENIVAQEIFESPKPYTLMRHFTDHPEEWHALVRTTAPAEIIRKVAALSTRLSIPASPPVPAVKTTTDAPPPPPSIGSRAAQGSDDELTSAAKSGDFRRYREIANAADIARMRSTGR